MLIWSTQVFASAGIGISDRTCLLTSNHLEFDVAPVILVLRTYTMYQRSRKVLVALVFSWAVSSLLFQRMWITYSTLHKVLFVVEMTSVIYWTKSPSGEFSILGISAFNRPYLFCRNRFIIDDTWNSIMSPARYHKPHRSLGLCFFISL